MNRIRQWSIFSAVLVLLLAFAACEGESPTEPSRGGGTGGGATTPPTNASIALAVSNPTPLVGSTTTITATVTKDNQPVPNGTAVEFSTNLGAFTDTSNNSTVRTTTGGVAAATLTSSAAGTATVTVRVNNVNAVATITFTQQPTQPPPPDTAPAITSISPSKGKPAGGDLVTISGRNFEPPLRVLFGETTAQIVSSSATQISVISPPVQFDSGEQSREVTITVITKAGTAGEAQATGGPFRYEMTTLTPTIYQISPSSGPNDGNTRVTIIGDGFQSPVKVFFGILPCSIPNVLCDEVEANVEQISFNQIIALTPPATGMGASLANRQVATRIKNVASNTQVIVDGAFRYGPGMQITSVGPTVGSAFESTKVTIEGWGFDDQKVAVTIGGIAAQPIFVSGTKIIALTGLPVVNSCGDITGPVSVTNVEHGTTATAEGITFTYRVPQPAIVSIVPTPAAPGSTVTITVAGAGPGPARFTVGDRALAVATSTFSGLDGTYTVVLPNTFVYDTQTCTTGLGVEGEQFVETAFDVKFENVLSGCSDTFENGLAITPPDTSCRVPPANAAVAPPTVAIGTITVGSSGSGSATISNTGGQPLTVTAVNETGDPEAEFAATGCLQVINPGSSCNMTITFTPGNAGPNQATYEIVTTANTVSVTATGTGQ